MRALIRRRRFLVFVVVLGVPGCADHDGWDEVLARLEADSAEIVEVRGVAAPASVSVERIATLAPADDASPRLPGLSVARGPRNTYVTTGTYRPAAFTVHDSAGALLAVVGREGSGPEEFRDPRLAVSDGDSLFVFDSRNHRIAVLDADFVVTRTFAASSRIADLVVRDGVLLAFSPMPFGAPGRELHLLSRDGGPVRHFGERREQVDMVPPRPIAIGPGGEMWAGYYNQYVVQQFDTTGVLRRSLVRRVPWFEPVLQRTGRPSPYMAAIAFDAAGLMHVLATRPVEGWTWPPPRLARDGFHQAALRPNEWAEGFRQILEVIDPVRLEVIATAELPHGWFAGFIEPGVLYSFRNDDDDVIHIDIWRARLNHATSHRNE